MQSPDSRTPAGNQAISSIKISDVAQSFGPEYLDETACRARLINLLHPNGAFCPDCGLSLDGASKESFHAGRRCVCGRCGRWFTATSGTFLQGAQLDYRQVYLLATLIDLMRTGINTQLLADIIDISADTCRLWMKRFDILEGATRDGR